MAITIQNRQRRLKLDRKALMPWAQALFQAAGFGEGEICARIVSRKRIQELNRRFRGVDEPTDVMAFPFEDVAVPGEASPIGDIVISGDAVLDQAERYGHSPEEEFRLLLAHGVAHLLGHEDYNREDRRRMGRVQQRLMKAAHVALETDL